jgi:hypothetical protein
VGFDLVRFQVQIVGPQNPRGRLLEGLFSDGLAEHPGVGELLISGDFAVGERAASSHSMSGVIAPNTASTSPRPNASYMPCTTDTFA